MKNLRILLVAIALFVSAASFAQFSNVRNSSRPSRPSSSNAFDGKGPQTGYKGFIEGGYTFGSGDFGEDRLSLMTAHGGQFSPHFFAGIGAGVSYYTSAELFSIPIFADFRATLFDSGITPYFETKIGYSVLDVEGFFLSPSIGCRFGMGSNSALTVSIGYEMQSAEFYFVGRKNCGGLALKVGFDF